MAARHRLLIIGPRSISGHEGGVEKFAEEFVKHATGSADITVLVLKASEDGANGVKVIAVPSSRLLRTDKAYYLLYALRHLILGRYDRVFILGINFAMLAPVARLFGPRGTRVVVRSGSIDHTLKKWGRLMSSVIIVSERLSRFAHAVVAVGPSIQRHLESIGIETLLIRNGLQRRETAAAPRPAAARARTVLAVGRLTAQKNYTVLIEAAAALGPDCPPITVVGGADNSPETGLLMDLVKSRDVRNITFVGTRPRQEVLSHMREAALFINCSHHEGMSNAILEAIQEGMALVLSDIDANRDLQFDDRFYFRPNDPQMLATRIRGAMEDLDSFVLSPDRFDDWKTTIDRFLDVLGIADQPATITAQSATATGTA